MARIRELRNKLVMRLIYEMAFYPFYAMLVIVLLLWLGEGVAEQSGWATCPRP